MNNEKTVWEQRIDLIWSRAEIPDYAADAKTVIKAFIRNEFVNKSALREKIQDLKYSDGCSCNGDCYPDKFNTALDSVLALLNEQTP